MRLTNTIREMRAATRGVVAAGAAFVAAYLCGSFVEVSFSIADWHIETRAIVAVLGGMLGLAVGLATFSVHAD